MTKPPFDPNKPYQVVSQQKPTFDPNKPWQAVNEEPNMLEKAGQYMASLKNLPSYTVGSIPVLGPAVTKAAAAAGSAMITMGGTPEEYEKAYQGALEGEKKQRAEFEQQHPTLSLGAGVVGASLLPGPGRLFAEAKAAAPLIQRVLPQVGNIAAQVGVTGAEVAADAALRDRDAEEAAKSAMKWQAGISSVIPVLRGVAGKIPQMFTGIKPETVAKYKARAPQINAESEEQLIRDIQSGHENVVAKPVKAAKDAVNQAKEAADQAKMIYRENLKGREVPPELTQQVFEGTKQARKIVSSASGEGFDALAASGKTIPTEPMIKHLDGEMSKMEIGGKVHPGDMPTYNALQQEKDFLQQFGPEMSPVDGKKLIQTLDRMEERAWDQAAQAGGHVSPGDKAMINYRRTIDAQLKQIPEYAAPMEKASSTMKAIEKFRDVVGKNEQQIERSLKSGGRFKEEAIKGIEQATGNEYLPQLGPIREAQDILSTPSRYAEEVSRLPESQASAAASRAAEEVAEQTQPMAHLGNMGSAQSALRRVESEVRPDYRNIEALKMLGSRTGEDYLQRAEDLSIQRALNQGYQRGSRNVNLGAISGHGILKGVGDIMGGHGEGAGGFGAVVGAGLGALADQIGPRKYKEVIDFSMSPAGQRVSKILEDAYRRGPQVGIQAFRQLMINDPNLNRIMNRPSEER